MKFHFKSISLACVLLGGCTTHYYYPAYESGLTTQGSRLRPSPSLEGKKIQLDCQRLDVAGRDVVDPDFCRKISAWITASRAAVIGEPTETETTESQSPDLLLRVRSATISKEPAGLETFFMITSLGFYPTQTDRWCTIEISIFDGDKNPLSSGSFKAMFRTYFGWAYFLMARVHGLWQKPVTYRATMENSEDFYHYLSSLMRNAQLIEDSDTEESAPDAEVAP